MDEHGGNIFAHKVKYDFSANLNPLGMPESVKKAVFENAGLWECYPDSECTELIANLSEYEQFPAEQIVCGNGAADLIYRIVQAVRPERALLCVPTFGEYQKALSEQNCIVKEYPLDSRNHFLLTEDFLTALTPDLDMLFLCHPNNPTGRCIPSGLLVRIVEHCQKHRILFVCDECFLDFVQAGVSVRNYLHESVIILKAFTKLYAMPGLRLGYALFGSREISEKVRHTGQFWSVSAPAQAAGAAALKETDYREKTIGLITQERLFLQRVFSEIGLQYYPADANFMLFRAEPDLKQKLLRQKILIRSCSNYTGLDGTYYRTAIRNHQENQVLISALRRCVYG